MPGLECKLAEPVTGIGNKRRSRIRHQRHGFSCFQRRDELWPHFVRIVLVIRKRTGTDTVTLEQDARDAGILAGENISRSQRLQRANGDVAQIADGGGDEIKRALQRTRGNCGRPDPEFLHRLPGVNLRCFFRHTASNHSCRSFPAGRSSYSSLWAIENRRTRATGGASLWIMLYSSKMTRGRRTRLLHSPQ